MANVGSTLRQHTCAGTGLIALDVVFSSSWESATCWTGGSCANVLSILAYFGWDAHPVARLGRDSAAAFIKKDLARFNVHLDFIEEDEGVDTPVIIQQIHEDSNGMPTHRFYHKCPRCNSFLPRFRPVLVSKVNGVSSRLHSLQAFYFDRATPAAIEAARLARELGALIVFEPQSIKDFRLFAKALRECHIIKYSYERLGHLDELPNRTLPILQVETLGSEGLRYRVRIPQERLSEWRILGPFTNHILRDLAGSGDWCTAGIIHVLGQKEFRAPEDLSHEELMEALQFGQALGAINCSFVGARGAMYKLAAHTLLDLVKSILEIGFVRDTEVQSLGEHYLADWEEFCTVCDEKHRQVQMDRRIALALNCEIQ